MPENLTDATDSETGAEESNGEPEATAAELSSKLRTSRKAERDAKAKIAALDKQIEALNQRLKGFEDRNKSEDQRRSDELERARAEAAAGLEREQALTLALLKRDVAARKGIADWHEYLHGDDEEAIEAAADKLLERIGEPDNRRPAPNPRLGQGKEGKPNTAQQFASALEPLL